MSNTRFLALQILIALALAHDITVVDLKLTLVDSSNVHFL